MTHYFVTYASTQKTGYMGNPLGHSCILLSVLDDSASKIEVKDVWGFYGIPSPDDQNSWKRSFKKIIGLDLDFYGNHGFLLREKPCYLELNSNFFLLGLTFSLDKEQYERLSENCMNMFLEQEAAISEAALALHCLALEEDQFQIYKYEKNSREIYAYEQALAKSNHKPPRLHPYELRFDFEAAPPYFFHSRHSHNCKTQAISLLSSVLTPKQIALLTLNGTRPTVPKAFEPQEALYFHCTGPLSSGEDLGKPFYYHEPFGTNINPQIKCFFTLPPQIIEMDSAVSASLNCLKISKLYLKELKPLVFKLQRLEWILLNAGFAESHPLIEKLRLKYQKIAEICCDHPKELNHVFFGPEGDPLKKLMDESQDLLTTISQHLCIKESDFSGLPSNDQKEIAQILDLNYPQCTWSSEDWDNACVV